MGKAIVGEASFKNRFIELLVHDWRKRLLLLILAVAVGVVSSLLLNERPLLNAANESAWTAVQQRLGEKHRDTGAVTLVDLSSAIGPRKDRPITAGETLRDGTVLPSQSQVDFQLQVEGLIELLTTLKTHEPKAIFVDWQKTAPASLWDAEREQWRPGVHKDFKDTYSRFLSTLDSLGQTCQVFIAGDLVRDAVKARRKTAPGRRHDLTLLQSELPITEHGFFTLAPIQAGSSQRMPSVTDGLIAFHELEDRVKRDPKKLGWFEAVKASGGREYFWIDYGFAPSLVREAIYLNLSQWTAQNPSKELEEKLPGRIVFIADLTEPSGDDAIAIPVSREKLLVPLSGGGQIEVRGSGGIAHACAFLTRTQEPLYALPAGGKELSFFAALNILIAVVAWVASALLGAIFRSPLDRPLEVALEMFLLIVVTLVTVWFGLDLMTNQRILVPQIEGFLITRSVDTLLLVVLLCRKDKPSDKLQSTQARGTAGTVGASE